MSWINSNATYKQNSKNDLSFYHGFSKTPVEPNTSNGSAVTTLANATTKSGHTVSATEVWASEIPWFGLVPSKAVAVTRLSGITKKNDLVRVNGDKDYIYIGQGNEAFTEATWSTYWSPITLTNGMVLKNAAGEDVLRYYEKQQMQALEPNNNAGIDSKGFATRLFVDEETHTAVTTVGQGSVISQFAAGTDNIKNGIASSELNPVLYLGTTQKIAGTHYYDYNVSGTILWSTNVKSSTPKITCFRYIGKTVTQQVTEISSTVKTHSNEISEIKDKLGLGETDTPGTPTLGGRVTDNETALRVLLGLEGDAKVVATESITSTATTVASNSITTSLTGTTDGTIGKAITTAKQGAIEAAKGYTDGEITTAKASIKEVTDALAGRIAALEGVKLSVKVVDALPATPVINTIYLVPDEGSTTGTYVEYIAYKHEGSETVTTERIGTTAVDLEGYTTDAEHSALADRVTALDAATTGRVAVVEGKVKTLEETTVPALDTRLSAAEGNVTTLQGQVAALTTGDTSVDSKITAAKTELSNKSLASTSTGSTLVTVTTAGTVGTGMTTTVDTTALTTAIDTAKSGAIAAAKTETETQVGELDTKLSGQISALSQIVESNKTETDKTTDALAADIDSIKKVIGETENGENIIDVLSGIREELTSTTATANSAAQSAEGDTYVSASQSGTKITVSTNINAIDSKLAEEASVVGAAIKAAKQAGVAAGDAASQALATAKTQTLAQTGTLANMFTVHTAGTVGTGITGITITDAGLSKTISDAQSAATTAGQNAANAVKTELSAKSLAKTGTLTGMFSVATSGTVGTGITGITITDAGLSKTISDAESNAVTTALGSTITSVTAKDVETSPKVTVTLSGTVQTPVLQVVTDDIASAKELADLKQAVTDKNVTTTTAAQTVGVTATGNSIDVATASYTPATADAAGAWSNEAKLVTGTDVKEAIADINSKIDTLHSAAVTYKVFATLPTAAAEHKGIVALVPANTGDSAVAGSYVEYLCVETVSGDTKTYAWQRIGTTAADFTQYAKSVTINGSKVSTATATGDINLGTVITGITNESSIQNSSLVYGSIASDGKLTLGVASATTVNKGLVQLTDTVTASDSEKAVTGKAVAQAVSQAISDAELTFTNVRNGQAETENDLWGTTISEVDGVVTVSDGWVTNPNLSDEQAWNVSITKVEDNKAYTSAGFFANVQTEKIKDGSWMFAYCENLASFDSDLTSLENGERMFAAAKFTSFNVDLPSLTNGYRMFQNCSNLTSFTPDLSNLTVGEMMFYGAKFTSFNTDLSSLTNGSSMFSFCPNLETFSSDLSSLTNGAYMFHGSSELTSFTSDLSSLTKGQRMFDGCKLDTESLMFIADTINGSVTNKPRIDLWIGNTSPTEEEREYLTEIHNKGWDVLVNGSKYTPTQPSAVTTLDENGQEVSTPIPFWAKPVEVTEEEAEYVGQDGKFYQVVGGQFIFVSDPDTYGMFTCLEDAAANMRLTKIEK